VRHDSKLYIWIRYSRMERIVYYLAIDKRFGGVIPNRETAALTLKLSRFGAAAPRQFPARVAGFRFRHNRGTKSLTPPAPQPPSVPPPETHTTSAFSYPNAQP
jgi:hypothetical protein